MRVIYHIDNHAWNMAPLVKTAMALNRAKGIDKAGIAVTSVDMYERYKIADYLELQKQAPAPHLEEFPLADVEVYPVSTQADDILKRIDAMLLDMIRHSEKVDQTYMPDVQRTYQAHYKKERKKFIPLPDAPSMAYADDAKDAATQNNNTLIRLAFSQHIGKGEALDKAKKNLGEAEKIRIIKEKVAASGAEPEIHIVISKEEKYANALKASAAGNNKIFVVTPQDFARDMHKAILVEQWGGAMDEATRAAITSGQEALSKNKVAKYLEGEENDIRKMDVRRESFAAFLTNPPISAAAFQKR